MRGKQLHENRSANSSPQWLLKLRNRSLTECSKGLAVQAHHSYADAPPLEVLVYPEGKGTRPQLEDESQLNWVRQQRLEVPLMTSVCTGSLVFAAAGLLAHRPATTHWRSLETLAQLDPTIEVRTDERFVDDGDVVTSAGISAGIDMALHLVSRLAGVDRAREVRRGIQYDPAPPIWATPIPLRPAHHACRRVSRSRAVPWTDPLPNAAGQDA